MNNSTREWIASTALDISSDSSRRVSEALRVTSTESSEPLTLWLHGRLKRTCWYFKALYEYEAFVTTSADPSGPRYAVDEIRLSISRDVDSASYTHTCQRTDYCGKSDEVWKTGGACGRTCLTAGATYAGESWSTSPACID